MAQTDFLQGEITERFLPATGVDALSGADEQVAFSSLVCGILVGLYTAGVVFVFFTK